MTNDEQRIRELAHQIWESEGKPEGQSERHWQMACKLLQSEQQGDLQPSPAKTRKPRKKAASELPPEDETQLEKPALLGKPAGAKKPERTPRQPGSTAAKATKASKPAAKRSKE
ncbi:Protein of unknown function [Halopseudomonas litoralis]|uniref:DUF2934 domain-containing protein n=1 Tax=Halopseudomonas litoralis TaxID=797277 RepID=A0A1H1T7A7_9GAMM|nr:DUF2934 domain-containing protein [Halopseudomonas litoralis]SDS56105.1 Protein of unknown function [Halopseudomonas litoralis]